MNNGKQVDVLLVEDLEEDADLTMRTFRKSNLVHEVKWVEDGKEALDYLFKEGAYSGCKDTNPRVILLDIKIPKVGGLEVLGKIRENPSTRHIPVVMLTSSKEDKDIQRAYRQGANSYIVKPVEFREFAKTITEVGVYWLLVNETISRV